MITFIDSKTKKEYKLDVDELGRLIIPEGVSVLPKYTAKKNKKILHVILPKSLKKIESLAFTDCPNLEQVTFQGKYVQLEYQSFFNCPLNRLHYDDEFFFSSFKDDSQMKSLYLKTVMHRISQGDHVSDTVAIQSAIRYLSKNPERFLEETFLDPLIAVYYLNHDLVDEAIAERLKESYAERKDTLVNLAYADYLRRKENSDPFSLGEEEKEFLYCKEGSGIRITRWNNPCKILTIPAEIDGKKVQSVSSMVLRYVETVVLPPWEHIRLSSWIQSNVRTVIVPGEVRHLFGIAMNEHDLAERVETIILQDSDAPLESCDLSFMPALKEVKGKRKIRIENSTFQFCSELEHMNLPSDCEIIPERCFYGCLKLNISLPMNIKVIGKSAFQGAGIKEDIVFPKTLEHLGSRAFKQSRIKSVTFSEGIRCPVEDSTFEECFFLEKVSLPSTITSLKSSAFLGCDSIRKFHVSKENPVFDSGDRDLYLADKESKRLLLVCHYDYAKEDLTMLKLNCFSDEKAKREFLKEKFQPDLPSYLTAISPRAFRGNYSLVYVFLPKEIKSIEKGSFSGCDELKYIEYEGTSEEFLNLRKGSDWYPPNLKCLIFQDKTETAE